MSDVTQRSRRRASAEAASPMKRVRRYFREAEHWVYLAPLLLVLGGLILYPLLLNGYLSTLATRRITSGDATFVGASNYSDAFAAAGFWNSLRASFIITISAVVLAFLGGLALALALNRAGRGRAVLFALILVPWLLSPVVSGYAWRWLFNDRFGLINYALQSLGIVNTNIQWLARPVTATIAVIVTNAWRLTPYMALMLVAGLKAIPDDLYEAAAIDGARPFQRFRYITLPQLRYVIGVVSLYGFIWTFNDFSVPYVMTEGGPAGATDVLPIYLYRTAFRFLDFGQAAAIAVMMFIILIVLSVPYARRLTKGVTR